MSNTHTTQGMIGQTHTHIHTETFKQMKHIARDIYADGQAYLYHTQMFPVHLYNSLNGTKWHGSCTFCVISLSDGYSTSLESRFCIIDCIMGKMFPSSPPPSPLSSSPIPSKVFAKSSPAKPEF